MKDIIIDNFTIALQESKAALKTDTKKKKGGKKDAKNNDLRGSKPRR